VLAPGELGRATAALDIEDFASAGTAMPVPYNGSVARVNFGPLSAARVRRWLRNGEFDLIHIHEPITPSISLLALWAADVPVVATFHTATPRSRSMQLASGVLRATIEKIDAGIAVSESARNVVVQHLGRDAVVIPNGIRFDDFAKGHLRSSHPQRPRLIFIGRLDEPRKGLDVLLAAVPLIRQTRPNLEVIVAGQGTRPLPSWCCNLGTITNEAKTALLRSADVFVAPQLARESFGIVLLEAMASGVQIVASDLPSFVDVLGAPQDEQRLGEVFAVGDHRALARAVLEVLDCPDPLQASRARRTARSYDWSRVGATVLAIYRAVLSAAPTRRTLRGVG
jgi:phosphatidylinositol alpha-mannosyltransferase